MTDADKLARYRQALRALARNDAKPAKTLGSVSPLYAAGLSMGWEAAVEQFAGVAERALRDAGEWEEHRDAEAKAVQAAVQVRADDAVRADEAGQVDADKRRRPGRGQEPFRDMPAR